MRRLTFVIVSLCLSIVNGQTCRGRYDTNLVGYCDTANRCRGTALTMEQCETSRCCFNATTTIPSAGNCLDQQTFINVYNSTRGVFLAKAFNYGFNQAEICTNCQAKAAFLAIAATMTNEFQQDEVDGESSSFTSDDSLYGNENEGDGSRYRRRGFFGLRGRLMYQRADLQVPGYQLLNKPENAAVTKVAMDIAAKIWKSPDLQSTFHLTSLADGTFYGFSMMWHRLTGGTDQLAQAAQYYSKYLRLLECGGGDLYPGQGGQCRYNSTHSGFCIPGCIRGLEESGEWCGCSGEQGEQCTGAPAHIRCCLGSCSQELKMDLGLVLDASGSIGWTDYQTQLRFVENLLNRTNVGQDKTHVAIIKYSYTPETLTRLDADYELNQKIQKLRAGQYTGGGTYTADALLEANRLFSSANGLRPVEEGAAQVIFILTDGASNSQAQTLAAADVLKNKSINLISVGIGSSLNLYELHNMCTPPSSENYFAINNYNALDSKLNQFMAKTCSEPAIVPGNTTVTSEVGRDKYKFFKLKIVFNGNKLMIKVKLFNGKVKLFYSFKARNPKDPAEFSNYESRSTWSKIIERIQTKSNDEYVTELIDRPADLDTDVVFIGIKGVENENKFEVKLEDCQQVKCSSASKTNFLLFLVFLSLFSRKFFD